MSAQIAVFIDFENIALWAEQEFLDFELTSLMNYLQGRGSIAIVRALYWKARLLIMDEPTAAITEADVERLFEIIRLLKERQVGIVYISHRLHEVFDIGDRVTVGAHTGRVERITITYTALVSDNGSAIFVPNRTMVSETIVNRSGRDPRRLVSASVPVRLGASLTEARRLVENALDRLPNADHSRSGDLYPKVGCQSEGQASGLWFQHCRQGITQDVYLAPPTQTSLIRS